MGGVVRPKNKLQREVPPYGVSDAPRDACLAAARKFNQIVSSIVTLPADIHWATRERGVCEVVED